MKSVPASQRTDIVSIVETNKIEFILNVVWKCYYRNIRVSLRVLIVVGSLLIAEI